MTATRPTRATTAQADELRNFGLSTEEVDDPRPTPVRKRSSFPSPVQASTPPKRAKLELARKPVTTAPIVGTRRREPRLDAPEIRELRERIARWLSIPEEDTDMIDVILAVFKSHELPGDPLWAIIIDASGGGSSDERSNTL